MPTLTLSLPVARTLVQLFATDTAAAILLAGHVPSNPADLQQFVQDCCKNICLAEKDVIAQAEEQIIAMLTSGTGYSVPMLEDGYGSPRTLR
ncbi:NHLP-related RiPP peptide [Stenotrophomonas maltophilia]|uniref:NHLP-related RiPP peptide n=1 Tax=Stenotrophomonas maltophilia TaxID=40324 RepID=UPI000C15B590|nr:NHLP-related RiPP peptide [Stenotrophomonas maltophilia]